MLFTLESDEFDRMLALKRRVDNANFAKFTTATALLSTEWLSELEPAKVSILMFILGRTLYYRREAEQIWARHFLDGVKKADGTRVAVGLKMSENTLQKHLTELINDDFLNAYRLVSTKGAEFVGRLFEINFKKLQAETAPIEGNDMLPIPKNPRQKSSNLLGKQAPQKLGDPPPKFGVQNYEYIYGLGKPNLSPTSGEPSGSRLAVARKARSSATQVERSAAETVTMITQRYAEARETRTKAAASKAPWLLSQKEMQAVVDAQMEATLPNEPRLMVTGQSYGLLKKRLKDSAPKDFSDFIGWCFRYWTDTARANRNATQKRIANGTEARNVPMPLSPDFTVLALRYPYFLKVYQSFLADRREIVREDEHGKQVRQLEQALRRSEQEKNTLQRRARPRSVVNEVSAPRISRSVPRSTGASADDLPTWEEFNQREDRHAKQR